VNRRVATFSVALGLLAHAVPLTLPGVAHAQSEREDSLGMRHHEYSSPQHWAAEIRFSPYRPRIDDDPHLGGTNPYATVFGQGQPVMLAAEFDWQAYRIPHIGTIGPGLSIGYWSNSANASFVTPHNGSTVSGETTKLEIFPFYAVAVFRADVFWRDFHVPFVPYGKAGLALGIWRASNTLGTSNYNGASGAGGSWGYDLSAGLALNLNWLDEYSAKNFDESMGVNNTYLFAEGTLLDLSGLGIQSNVLRVGARAWTFGLAFEF
jgi:hypothetical protein